MISSSGGPYSTGSKRMMSSGWGRTAPGARRRTQKGVMLSLKESGAHGAWS